MPSPMARRSTEQNRRVDERRYILDLWLDHDANFFGELRRISRALMESDRRTCGWDERIRRPWTDLCDDAGYGDPALFVYTGSLATAVRNAGLRPTAEVAPRDFIFNAITHSYCWFLASGIKQWDSPVEHTDDSPSVHLNLNVLLMAWNPESAIQQARREILLKWKALQSTEFADWTPPKRSTHLPREAWCLFLRVNRRMSVPRIALSISERGCPIARQDSDDSEFWYDDDQRDRFSQLEADSQVRVVNRDISNLAKRHGLDYAVRRRT